MKNKSMKVQDLLDKFKLKVVSDSFDRTKLITAPSIHRLGFELTGLFGFDSNDTGRSHVIAWGTKEEKYLMSLDNPSEILKKVFENIDIPLILLSVVVSEEAVKLISEIAEKHKIPVVHTELHLATIRSTIGHSLTEYFAKVTEVHASLVMLNGMGVLIIGKSGIGKSESVLELVQGGHTFVSDDTVGISRIGDHYFGRHSEYTKGFMEIRGVGIIDVGRVYGQQHLAESTQISLVVELVEQDGKHEFDRTGQTNLGYEICGGEIPKIQIPINKGRSTSSLILAATSLHAAGKREDAMEVISKRIFEDKK